MVIVADVGRGDSGGTRSTTTPDKGLSALIVVDPTPADGVKAWTGLTVAEAALRRAERAMASSTRTGRLFGGTVRAPRTPYTLLSLLLLTLLVAGSASLALVWHQPRLAIAVALVAAALAGIMVVSARRPAPALSDRGRAPGALIPVRRDGRLLELQASEVVPGDVIILAPGRRIPADAMIVDSDDLIVEEQTRSGGLTRVEKQADPEPFGGTPLAERSAMVFAGSVVTEGYGTAIVLRV